MKIKFENLGPVRKGIIDFKKLKKINIIMGPNNSGKTYLSYLMYTYFKVLNNFMNRNKIVDFKNYENNIFELTDLIIEKIIKSYKFEIEEKIKEELPITFHTNKEYFENFKIEIDMEEIKEKLKKKDFYDKIYFYNSNKIIEMRKENNKLKIIKTSLEDTFNQDEIKFSNFSLKKGSDDELINEAFSSFIRKNIFDERYRIFSFPAERSGAVLFYKQLLEKRSEALREFELKQKISINEISRYSEPINDYIRFLSSITEEGVEESDIYKEILKNSKEIIEGEMEIKEGKELFKTFDGIELDMGLVSSTVKTLDGFFLYLKYKARKGDIVFIDEIELNLHPENQRKIIRVIKKLSDLGINFILSTHSPIITQEINNMILASQVKEDKIRKICQDNNLEIEHYSLKREDINALFLNKNTIESINIDNEGLETISFNEVIGEMDNLYQELLFNL